MQRNLLIQNSLIKKYSFLFSDSSYYCLPLRNWELSCKIANLKEECEGTVSRHPPGTPLSYHVIHSLLLAQPSGLSWILPPSLCEAFPSKQQKLKKITGSWGIEQNLGKRSSVSRWLVASMVPEVHRTRIRDWLHESYEAPLCGSASFLLPFSPLWGRRPTPTRLTESLEFLSGPQSGELWLLPVDQVISPTTIPLVRADTWHKLRWLEARLSENEGEEPRVLGKAEVFLLQAHSRPHSSPEESLSDCASCTSL